VLGFEPSSLTEVCAYGRQDLDLTFKVLLLFTKKQ